jgi:hypothetical protein
MQSKSESKCFKTFQGLQDRFLKHTSSVDEYGYSGTTTLENTTPLDNFNYNLCMVSVPRPHPLYFSNIVRRDYSSSGPTGSTSAKQCASTTRRPDCTSSTVPMSCIRTHRLSARLLVGRSHWLSLRVGHCVSCRDYSPSGLHWLYRAYAVHLDAPSRRSPSRRSVALALAVHPVTASRGATTRRPDCTGSTMLMPCIRTHRLAARLLVNRSHSSCARSFRCASWLPVSRPQRIYFTYVAHPGASARRAARHSARRTDRHQLCRLRHTSGCLDTSCGSSCGSSRRSSSTTSTTPRVRVPRNVARLAVDYFDYTARPGA